MARSSRFDESSRIVVVPPGKQAEALRPLPVETLRLPGNVVEILHELNIFRIDQVLMLPRTELPSRFGNELLLQIDRALGRVPEIPTPERSVDPLEATWQFEPAVADGRILIEVFDHLLERILGQMSLEHLGVQRLLCSLKVLDHDSICFPVELLRPSASQRQIMELVRLQVERLRIPAEVAEMTVQAAVVLPLEFHQEEIFDGGQNLNGRKEFGELLERLSSRFGERAVLRPELQADAQPEFAWRYEPWLAGALRSEDSVSRLNGAMRPAILTNRPVWIGVISIMPGGRPEQFHWKQRQYIIERYWGPERIEIGWWRGDDVRRDYYIVETDTGERFWLFRDRRNGSWFLHGVFA